MEIEQYLKDFEVECQCVLSMHDLANIFYDADGNRLIAGNRGSHRKRIPVCDHGDRQYCIGHCMNQLNRRVLNRHERSFINHCGKGVIEVVAPLYQDQQHVGTLFAGVWQSRFRKHPLGLNPVDRAKVDRLRRLLPLFGQSLLERLTQIRSQGKQEFSRKAEIRSFVTTHARDNISLQDLASQLRLSPSRTCHLVKECFGRSFNNLVAEERIERARQLLISTDYRMNEIAELTGLGTPEHFSRTFKKHTKMSPRDYRSRYQLVME